MNAPKSNAASWGKAGREAAKSFYSIAETTRKYSPRYDEQAQVGLKARSLEKQAAIKAELTARKAANKAELTMAGADLKIDRDKALAESEKTKRKAGMVAGAGKLIGLALTPDEEPIRPEKTDYSQFTKYYDNKDAKIRAELAGLDKSPEPSSGSSAGGDTPGKAPVAPGKSGAISSQQMLGGRGSYSPSDMAGLLTKHGMSPENARILGAVGFGESGGRPGIDTVQSGLDPNRSNEYSVGLFQINHQAHGDKLARRGWTSEDLRDPDKNAQIAIEVFREAGNRFTPWSVYTSGAYQQHLK